MKGHRYQKMIHPQRARSRRGLGSTAETNPTPVREILSSSYYLPVPYAQQVFSLVPAAAGVFAGLMLAQKFASARATHVKASEVITASVLSFAASFAVVFMIRSFRSYDEEDEDAGGADVDVDVGIEA